MKPIKNNENPSLCATCGGACCKRMAGSVHPEQFSEITVESLKKAFYDGYQWDYWEGNPTKSKKYAHTVAFYLRPQHKNSLKKIIDTSWGGECKFLTEAGCSLSFTDRPAQCQELVPKPDMASCSCKKYTKKAIAIAWLPHNETILAAINELRQENL